MKIQYVPSARFEKNLRSVTNKILPEIEEWQKRPLCAVYPIVYIDAIVFNVRNEGIIRKQAAYVILGISEEGHKEVLSITIGDNESAKFWLSALNELKNRGVRDIFVLCADGLSGISEAISAAFPIGVSALHRPHGAKNVIRNTREPWHAGRRIGIWSAPCSSFPIRLER